jgi:hypothetical protein
VIYGFWRFGAWSLSSCSWGDRWQGARALHQESQNWKARSCMCTCFWTEWAWRTFCIEYTGSTQTSRNLDNSSPNHNLLKSDRLLSCPTAKLWWISLVCRYFRSIRKPCPLLSLPEKLERNRERFSLRWGCHIKLWRRPISHSVMGDPSTVIRRCHYCSNWNIWAFIWRFNCTLRWRVEFH